MGYPERDGGGGAAAAAELFLSCIIKEKCFSAPLFLLLLRYAQWTSLLKRGGLVASGPKISPPPTPLVFTQKIFNYIFILYR